MSDSTEFIDVPVSGVQIGANRVQHKNFLRKEEKRDEFESFNSPFDFPKKLILMECKQDTPEEIICVPDEDVFKDHCAFDAQHIPKEGEELPEAFIPPDISSLGLGGNIGEFESTIDENAKMIDPAHKFQESKKPMHAPTGKYHIMELFWFLNPLYTTKLEDMALEEAHFCQLSFNIDFGNLKVTFYKVPNGALEGHKIYLMSCQRMTSVSIYPSSLFKLIRSFNDYKNSVALSQDPKPVTVTCMEQLIFKTSEQWQQERPMAVFETTNSIKLTIKDPKWGDGYYIFQGWQQEALLHAANFILNQGLALTGQNIVVGNRVG